MYMWVFKFFVSFCGKLKQIKKSPPVATHVPYGTKIIIGALVYQCTLLDL